MSSGKLLLGLRLSKQVEESEVAPVLARVKKLLAERGVVVDSWEYDQPENLLFVYVRCKPDVLGEARSLIADVLNRELKPEGAPAVFGHAELVSAIEAMPSPAILGFLRRITAEELKLDELNEEEVFTLLAHYLCGCEATRVFITASFLGKSSNSISKAYESLMGKGYLRESGGLTEKAEKALEAIIDKARAKPPLRQMAIWVADEDGSLEPFDINKLAFSLYGCGVPHSMIPTILRHVERSLKGKRYISRRLLAAIIRGLLDELLPAEGAAERFYYYIYALDVVYVEEGGSLRRLTWKTLRKASREVLSERNLALPKRLTHLHAELVAAEIRETVAQAPWYFEGVTFTPDDLKRIGRHVAPRVSVAWLDLAKASKEELIRRYSLRGESYLSAAIDSQDLGEQREHAVKAMLLLSSSLLLKQGILPSNSLALNLGVLRNAARRASGSNVQATLSRICKVSAELSRMGVVVKPKELRRAKRLLNELQGLIKQVEAHP